MIQFLDMKFKKITKVINHEFYLSNSHDHMILMNKNDLFVIEDIGIIIIDIQKKEIIKEIKLKTEGFFYSMYKLSNNILLAGHWRNYIEQLEYDEIKKEFKTISNTRKKEYGHLDFF